MMPSHKYTAAASCRLLVCLEIMLIHCSVLFFFNGESRIVARRLIRDAPNHDGLQFHQRGDGSLP